MHCSAGGRVETQLMLCAGAKICGRAWGVLGMGSVSVFDGIICFRELCYVSVFSPVTDWSVLCEYLKWLLETQRKEFS